MRISPAIGNPSGRTLASPLPLAGEGQGEGFGAVRRIFMARLTARTLIRPASPATFSRKGRRGCPHRLAGLLLRCFRPHRRVVQHWSEPAFDLFDRHVLAGRVVLDLIALDLGDAEIMRFRMGDVEAGDR